MKEKSTHEPAAAAGEAGGSGEGGEKRDIQDAVRYYMKLHMQRCYHTTSHTHIHALSPQPPRSTATTIMSSSVFSARDTHGGENIIFDDGVGVEVAGGLNGGVNGGANLSIQGTMKSVWCAEEGSVGVSGGGGGCVIRRFQVVGTDDCCAYL